MGLGQIPSAGGGGTPPVADTTLKRLALTPDSLTGSAATSALDISQTWNTSGNPTAIKLNVTNTASGGSSLLMDLQVGGTSKFKVDKAGAVSANNNASAIWKYGPNSGDPYVFSILFNGSALANLNNGGGFQATSFNIAGQNFATGSYGAVVVGADILHLGNLDTQINRHAAASFQFGANHATIATTQRIKAHNVTAGKGAGLDLVGGSSGNGANSGDVRMMAGTAEGVKVYHDETAGAAGIGFFGVGGTLRPTTSFSGVTFLPGMGTQVTEDATFGGYTLAQVVSALQALGLLS